MSTYLREGAVAPEAVVLNLTPETTFGVDLSTVTAGVLRVQKVDGTTATWTCTRSNQTITTLTLTYLLAPGDIPKSGRYVVYAELTLPAGTVRSDAIALTVKGKYEVV